MGFMVLFVFTFPFPLAHIFFNEEQELNGFFTTPFISALVAFAFFGMNSVGIEIENPFGDDENDLAIVGMLKRVNLDTPAMFDLLACSDQAVEPRRCSSWLRRPPRRVGVAKAPA